MMTASIGPVCAVVVDVVHPAVRATAASVLSLTQNLFGLAAGPLLTGFLSDAYGLPFALSVIPGSAFSPPRCSCSPPGRTCPIFKRAEAGRAVPIDQQLTPQPA